MKNYFPTALFILLLGACAADVPPIVGCEPVGEIKPVCNMKTPEDIAALPDGKHLLLAHFGGMGKSTGSISLFDTASEVLTPLYPATSSVVDSTERWGDAACATPPNASFGPHGTHLHRLADGRWRYLVVNHGDREAVELFELTMAGDAIALNWRGCVMAASDTVMNDVVGLANGDLIYSRMFSGKQSWATLKALLGMSTGELWRWNKGTGLNALPATMAALPNGLEISADERVVFANMYLQEQVWKVDLNSGDVVASADIAFADNSAWGPDGRLWIATHNGGFSEILSCFENPEETCPASFEIVALNPDTMESEPIFTHRGPPMGVATIAVAQAGRIYMGSFAGDRMISIPESSLSR